jgi:small subunit ribosomal protein S16
MPAKIRLARRGRRKRPFYHIVVADVRAPRDGKFIDSIGSYNPMTKPATIEIDRDKAYEWLMKGAQPTNTVNAILRFKGVLYKKHLQRGVTKGALTQEAADQKLQEWIDAKEAKVAARVEETRKEKEAFLKMVSGEAKPAKVKAATEADAAAFRVEGDDAAADAPAPEAEAEAEAPAAEAAAPEAPKEEAPAPEVKEEAKPAEEVAAVAAAAAAPVVEEKKEEAPASADDLTKIEGIGPKVSEVLTAAGIGTFALLGAATPDKVKEILAEAGSRFKMQDPTTWPKQATMASNGEWDALKKWQDELDGGKEPAAKSEEE